VFFPRWKLDFATRQMYLHRNSRQNMRQLLQSLVWRDQEVDHVLGMEGQLLSKAQEEELHAIERQCQKEREKLHQLEANGELTDDRQRESLHDQLNQKEDRLLREAWQRIEDQQQLQDDPHELGKSSVQQILDNPGRQGRPVYYIDLNVNWQTKEHDPWRLYQLHLQVTVSAVVDPTVLLSAYLTGVPVDVDPNVRFIGTVDRTIPRIPLRTLDGLFVFMNDLGYQLRKALKPGPLGDPEPIAELADRELAHNDRTLVFDKLQAQLQP
jgi:hypothetical protein